MRGAVRDSVSRFRRPYVRAVRTTTQACSSAIPVAIQWDLVDAFDPNGWKMNQVVPAVNAPVAGLYLLRAQVAYPDPLVATTGIRSMLLFAGVPEVARMTVPPVATGVTQSETVVHCGAEVELDRNQQASVSALHTQGTVINIGGTARTWMQLTLLREYW